MIGSRVIIWYVPMLHICGQQIINIARRRSRDVVSPRMIDAMLKHLSMLRIGMKLGDNMSGLALVAAASLLKCHSGASEASEKGHHLRNTAFIWKRRTHWWHSWSRECGNSVPIQGQRVDDLFQLTQFFQCQTCRFTERLDNKSISGGSSA